MTGATSLRPAGGGAEATPAPAAALLALENVEVIYERVILVLRGLSLEVPEGKIVALLGSNGAGKTTTMKAITGILPSERGEVTDGRITFRGQPLRGLDPAQVVRLGISLVPEGRRVFPHLSVHENLLAGAHTRRLAGIGDELERVYTLFPVLAARRDQRAGFLSGGEQQMLAIGRALMARPALIMLDEPSLGLAPRAVAEIFEMVQRLNRELATTVLLVEQNARRALAIADHAYVMERGRIVLEGQAAELAGNPDVQEFYLGLSASGARRSYREVKHYRRRKRWL